MAGLIPSGAGSGLDEAAVNALIAAGFADKFNYTFLADHATYTGDGVADDTAEFNAQITATFANTPTGGTGMLIAPAAKISRIVSQLNIGQSGSSSTHKNIILSGYGHTITSDTPLPDEVFVDNVGFQRVDNVTAIAYGTETINGVARYTAVLDITDAGTNWPLEGRAKLSSLDTLLDGAGSTNREGCWFDIVKRNANSIEVITTYDISRFVTTVRASLPRERSIAIQGFIIKSDPAEVRAAAVQSDRHAISTRCSKYLTIKDCEFWYTGGSGIFAAGSVDCQIINNRFYHLFDQSYDLKANNGIYNDFTVSSVAIVNGGTGYVVSDVVTLDIAPGSPEGGAGAQATFTITAVDGGGAVTALTRTTNGLYSPDITDKTDRATTGGTGTGLTVTVATTDGYVGYSGYGFGGAGCDNVNFVGNTGWRTRHLYTNNLAAGQTSTEYLGPCMAENVSGNTGYGNLANVFDMHGGSRATNFTGNTAHGGMGGMFGIRGTCNIVGNAGYNLFHAVEIFAAGNYKPIVNMTGNYFENAGQIQVKGESVLNLGAHIHNHVQSGADDSCMINLIQDFGIGATLNLTGHVHLRADRVGGAVVAFGYDCKFDASGGSLLIEDSGVGSTATSVFTVGTFTPNVGELWFGETNVRVLGTDWTAIRDTDGGDLPYIDGIVWYEDGATLGADSWGTDVQFKKLTRGRAINRRIAAINMVFEGGGDPLTTGATVKARCGNGIDLTSFEVLADASGAIEIDVRVCDYANAPPDSGDSIVAALPIELSAAQKAQVTTLTGWDTAIPEKSYIWGVITAVDGSLLWAQANLFGLEKL